MGSWSASYSYVNFQVGPRGFSGKPLVVKQSRNKRCGVLKCATIEEIEAEKSIIEKDVKERMEKTIENVRFSFSSIRTGRASAVMLDKVEYYGTPVSLKSIVHISTPNSSSLMVQPYDKSGYILFEGNREGNCQF
ncbi:ribosome-recycling factor, chloroplastic-like [Primulina eburnea]|uniref:ribosome-recycling factor, chloroplastic-like n=1 Tax=Primulina eburnea TaxID=1245227 RepID=UPI003C6CC0EF